MLAGVAVAARDDGDARDARFLPLKVKKEGKKQEVKRLCFLSKAHKGERHHHHNRHTTSTSLGLTYAFPARRFCRAGSGFQAVPVFVFSAVFTRDKLCRNFSSAFLGLNPLFKPESEQYHVR